MIFAIMRGIHYIKTHIIPRLQVTAWISYRGDSTVNYWKRGKYAAENKSGSDTTVIGSNKLNSYWFRAIPYNLLIGQFYFSRSFVYPPNWSSSIFMPWTSCRILRIKHNWKSAILLLKQLHFWFNTHWKSLSRKFRYSWDLTASDYIL